MKKVQIEKFQTFLKSDLEDAINYEVHQWALLEKRLPTGTDLKLPFSPSDAYWPEIEESKRQRKIFEEKNFPLSPHQNASQSHSSYVPDIGYLEQYRRGLADAEKRRMDDIQKINKDYAKALNDAVKARSFMSSEQGESFKQFDVMGEVLADSVNKVISLTEKSKNDDPEIHWIWKYCIPYAGSGAVIAFLLHLIGR